MGHSTRIVQSSPPQPDAHVHTAPAQSPCPPQSAGQAVRPTCTEQSSPVKPASHVHAPASQTPWREHCIIDCVVYTCSTQVASHGVHHFVWFQLRLGAQGRTERQMADSTDMLWLHSASMYLDSNDVEVAVKSLVPRCVSHACQCCNLIHG